MHYLLSLLLLLTLTTCAQERTDREGLGLKGEVLAVFQYTHEPVREGAGWRAGPLQNATHEAHFFRVDGKQIEQLYLDRDYRAFQRYVITPGSGQSESAQVYDERGKVFIESTLIYEEGRLRQQEFFFADGRRQLMEHEYAEGSDLIATVHVSKNGSPKERIEMTYQDGLPLSVTTYDRRDSMVISTVYVLDADGNPLSKTITHSDPGLNQHTEYTDYSYDPQGNWIERHEWEDGELLAIGKRRLYYRDELERALAERLPGIWSSRKEGSWIEFSADGTFTFEQDADEKPSGNWTLTDGELLRLTPTTRDAYGGPASYQYRVLMDTFRLQLVPMMEEDFTILEIR